MLCYVNTYDSSQGVSRGGRDREPTWSLALADGKRLALADDEVLTAYQFDIYIYM